jgi:GNAT superfamily N-acetyltransferase
MACCGTRVFGCGALLPVDATTGEVKRMYVEPGHRGHGVGRAILQRLLDGARADGFDRIRLETSAVVMAPALRMYRSLGFVETGPFPESELVMEGLAHLTTYMHLDLRPADPVSKAPHS